MNVHLKFLSPSATVYTHKLFGNGQMLRLSVKKKNQSSLYHLQGLFPRYFFSLFSIDQSSCGCWPSLDICPFSFPPPNFSDPCMLVTPLLSHTHLCPTPIKVFFSRNKTQSSISHLLTLLLLLLPLFLNPYFFHRKHSTCESHVTKVSSPKDQYQDMPHTFLVIKKKLINKHEKKIDGNNPFSFPLLLRSLKSIPSQFFFV